MEPNLESIRRVDNHLRILSMVEVLFDKGNGYHDLSEVLLKFDVYIWDIIHEGEPSVEDVQGLRKSFVGGSILFRDDNYWLLIKRSTDLESLVRRLFQEVKIRNKIHLIKSDIPSQVLGV